MKVYEKIKEMSIEEMQAFLSLLGADADHLYCNYVCENRPAVGDICDLEPCKDIDELKEVLNADYSLIEESVRGEYEKMFCS